MRSTSSSCGCAATSGAPASVSASRSTTARAGSSVPGSRSPSHTSPPGSCRRQSSLQTTGMGRVTSASWLPLCVYAHRMTRMPPAAPQQPGPDPFAWMRDKDRPDLREYLAAERAYYDEHLARVRGSWAELRDELIARVPPEDESVHWARGGRRYFTRTRPGQNYPQFCRIRPGGEPEILLDQEALLADPAATGGYVELGVREVSPDGRLLAYSVDFTGDEVYQLRIRDLGTGQDLPERIERTYYGLAWAADSASLFYTVTDQAYRPFQVWRHELGTDPGADVLVYQEDDQRFDLIVRATRSGRCVLIETESRDT